MLYTNTVIIEAINLRALTDLNVIFSRTIVPIGSNLLEIDKKSVKNFDKVESLFKKAFLSDGTSEEHIQGCKVFLFGEIMILVIEDSLKNIVELTNVEI